MTRGPSARPGARRCRRLAASAGSPRSSGSGIQPAGRRSRRIERFSRDRCEPFATAARRLLTPGDYGPLIHARAINVCLENSSSVLKTANLDLPAHFARMRPRGRHHRLTSAIHRQAVAWGRGVGTPADRADLPRSDGPARDRGGFASTAAHALNKSPRNPGNSRPGHHSHERRPPVRVRSTWRENPLTPRKRHGKSPRRTRERLDRRESW